MESFEESLDKVKKGFASAVNKVKGNSEPEPVPEDEQSFFTESVTSVSRWPSSHPPGYHTHAYGLSSLLNTCTYIHLQVKKAFNLTLKQRIIGFGICVGISAGCSILVSDRFNTEKSWKILRVLGKCLGQTVMASYSAPHDSYQWWYFLLPQGCALSLLNIAVFAVLFTVGTIAGLVR